MPQQLLKPSRVGSGIANGVLNVAVPEIDLNEAGISSLVGKSKAAGMTQYFWVRRQR